MDYKLNRPLYFYESQYISKPGKSVSLSVGFQKTTTSSCISSPWIPVGCDCFNPQGVREVMLRDFQGYVRKSHPASAWWLGMPALQTLPPRNLPAEHPLLEPSRRALSSSHTQRPREALQWTVPGEPCHPSLAAGRWVRQIQEDSMCSMNREKQKTITEH